jgi:acyl carrier protein phosphodiesterase
MQYHDYLPERTRYMLHYMIKDDWLSAYAREEGISRALSGMSRRTTFNSNLENAVETLKADYGFYHDIFNRFFPQLIVFSRDYLQKQ